MTLGLALHTTSPDLGLAIGDLNQSPRHESWRLDRALSIQLHAVLSTFLAPHALADLDYIAITRGPGGFTSTRMGVVTARTLGQQLDCPVYGISTLMAIAHAALRTAPFVSMTGVAQAAPVLPVPQFVAVEMPAQRGELFGAIYAVEMATDGCLSLQEKRADAVYQPLDWDACLASLDLVHRIQIPKAAGLGEYAIAVLALAQQQWQQGHRPRWDTVVPFYGQHPVTL